jgi:redox-sensitive bicupin YhaK (pirin superfamily)
VKVAVTAALCQRSYGEDVSNLDRTPGLTQLGGLAAVAPRPVHQVYAGRLQPLGGDTTVRRLLPNLGRRLVGAWCFVDHYGPEDISDRAGMSVPPHPHLGLQTVSWLLAGQVHHRDSLGNDVLVGTGELGLMTSGYGITHAEHSPVPHSALLHGVQLWVALPSPTRNGAAGWEHHRALPQLTQPGLRATVILGSVAGVASPGHAHSPIVGADLALAAGADVRVPLEPGFEHAALVMSGSVVVDAEPLAPGAMLYLGCGRRDLVLTAAQPARVLLLGGAPFEEQVVMWWNFVGRSHEEIAAARSAWESGARFGAVSGAGSPLAAPPLPPGSLKPGGRTR